MNPTKAVVRVDGRVLCGDGLVESSADFTLVPAHHRGHGVLYCVLKRGGMDIDRLRRVLAGLPMASFEGGGLVLAVVVSPWLRSDRAPEARCELHAGWSTPIPASRSPVYPASPETHAARQERVSRRSRNRRRSRPVRSSWFFGGSPSSGDASATTTPNGSALTSPSTVPGSNRAKH